MLNELKEQNEEEKNNDKITGKKLYLRKLSIGGFVDSTAQQIQE